MAKIVIECTEKIVSPDAQVMAVGSNEDQTTGSISETSAVLEIGNTVDFVIKDGESTKTLRGRILEIRGLVDETNETSTFTFLIDASEEYNSNILSVDSVDIETLTKEGCDPITAEELKKYVYIQDHNIVSYDDNDEPTYISTGDVVKISGIEEHLGKIISINTNIIEIDASSKLQSDILAFDTSTLTTGGVTIEKIN